MLTGKEAFTANDKGELIRAIMENDFITEAEGNRDISKDALDLIVKLTQTNPIMRLGVGKEGTPQHFSELKNHPWFMNNWPEGTSKEDMDVS